MGGPVPLEHAVVDRKLIVNESEAEQVRHIMQLYIKVGSVPELIEVLAKNGSHTKVKQRKDGGKNGGCDFKRGILYHLLSNRIYRGMTVHKGEAFDDKHEAIVSEELRARQVRSAGPQKSHRGGPPQQPLDATIIEDADFGRAIAQDLRRTSSHCLPILCRPHIEKLARMQGWSSMFETGKVKFPVSVVR